LMDSSPAPTCLRMVSILESCSVSFALAVSRKAAARSS
jgi:hypothetical protein